MGKLTIDNMNKLTIKKVNNTQLTIDKLTKDKMERVRQWYEGNKYRV